jgi:predicted TIM-barrel fold metal-dependent hydrolase
MRRAEHLGGGPPSEADNAARASEHSRTDAARAETPLAGPEPLIDVHAHFAHAGCGKAAWRELNAARLRAGDRIGITCHVASILGSWGHTSPTYFASPADVTRANDEMLALQAAEGSRVRSYVHVNPNDTDHALAEIARGVARGAVGVKLSASRRADDPVVDPVAAEAGARGLPVLHHVWQYRRREWGNQEASDGVELGRLAARHPRTNFILAHIGGGGDYPHTFAAVRELPNVFLDTSGSGVDRGMLDDALAAVGPQRIVWGCDVTMCTGLAKLRALEVIGLGAEEMAMIRWRNAVRIFPPGSFVTASEGRDDEGRKA